MFKSNISIKLLAVGAWLASGSSLVHAADATYNAVVTATIPSSIQLVSIDSGTNNIEYVLNWLPGIMDFDEVSEKVKLIGHHASNNIEFSVAGDKALEIKHEDSSGHYVPAAVIFKDKIGNNLGEIKLGNNTVTLTPGKDDFDPSNFQIALTAFGGHYNSELKEQPKPGRYTGTVLITASQTL